MKQYRAREKITQKMTREGAIEVNAATGKKKRISNRIRDADLANAAAQPEQAAQPQAAQDAAAQPFPGSSDASPMTLNYYAHATSDSAMAEMERLIA